MATLVIAGLVGSVTAHAAEWIQVLFATLLSLDFLCFILAYAYFAITNSDALRTERFTLQKIAIEHGLLGDSTTGLSTSNLTAPKVPTSSTLQIEHDC